MTTIPDIFIVTLEAWDVVDESVTTLRYAQRLGYTTKPTDTPADTAFDARVKEPCDMRRWMFGQKTTSGRSVVGVGQVVLLNGDGALDDLADPSVYSIDGRPITVRRGPASGGAYPGDFAVVFAGSMQYAEATPDEIRISIRDNQSQLVGPLQTEKYAGDNALPAGLEGTADDLKGKPKPVLYGKVLNIRPPCVNTSKLIYQVSDDEAESIDTVYDRGVPLGLALSKWTETDFDGVFGADAPLGCETDGAGTWVVVGAAGKIATSTDDGVTWTSQTSGVATSLNTVETDGAGTWVAAGSSGVLLSSTNLTSWTSRLALGGSSFYRVRYANSIWVAVGGAARLYTATSVATWTSRTSGFDSNASSTIRDVEFGNGLWVMGGWNFTDTEPQMAWALDPTSTWTLHTIAQMGLTDQTWELRGITFNKALQQWAANFTPQPDNAHMLVILSPDGKWFTPTNFTTITAEILQGNGQRMAQCQGVTMAISISQSASGRVYTSADGGFSWLARGDQSTSDVAWYDIAASPSGRVLLVGEDSGGDAIGSFSADIVEYASEADLLDDELAPTLGTYGVFLDAGGSYIRLGAEPAGEITCDATSGSSLANRYAGKVFTFVLTRAGFSAGEWDTSDITTLDAAADYVVGFWTDEETTFADVLDKIAASVGAGWFVDRAGVYRIKQLLLPTGTPAMDFVASDLKKPLRLVRPSESGGGVPTYQRKVRYAKNYTAQASDVAAGVTSERRAFLAGEWREAAETDTAILTANLLAKSQSEDSLLADEADAEAEATRRQVISGTQRRWFELDVALDDETFALDLNNVVSLTHSRHGLSGGESFRILGIDTRGEDRELMLTVWG